MSCLLPLTSGFMESKDKPAPDARRVFSEAKRKPCRPISLLVASHAWV